MKIGELAGLCRSHGIILLQEIHGNEAAILLQSNGVLRSHVFLHSFFIKDGQFCSDTGGIGFLIDKRYFIQESDGSL